MADIGTYGSSIFSPFPFKVMPEAGDIITYDWMDEISTFQQRFLRMATYVGTLGNGSYGTFNYSALRCDYFPPYFKVYTFNSSGTFWEQYVPRLDPSVDPNSSSGQVSYSLQQVGLGSVALFNNLGVTKTFMVLAYL